jgi:hypothetical protein
MNIGKEIRQLCGIRRFSAVLFPSNNIIAYKSSGQALFLADFQSPDFHM